MPNHDEARSQAARAAAELALVRVAHHYGDRPEFVLLGGLVPALLCAQSNTPHAGTTDVDVQVNLEISSGAVNAARLERSLRNAQFTPDENNIWRWRSDTGPQNIIKFELLADLDNHPSEAIIRFDGCKELGAVNLRGTGLVTKDIEIHTLKAADNGVQRQVQVNVAGMAGFLASKAAAAYSRRKPKDWYDIAFVLLHNDYGDASEAALRVRQTFGAMVVDALGSTLADLRANFGGPDAQGTTAYVSQIMIDNPDISPATAAADCQLAVHTFCGLLTDNQG